MMNAYLLSREKGFTRRLNTFGLSFPPLILSLLQKHVANITVINIFVHDKFSIGQNNSHTRRLL